MPYTVALEALLFFFPRILACDFLEIYRLIYRLTFRQGGDRHQLESFADFQWVNSQRPTRKMSYLRSLGQHFFADDHGESKRLKDTRSRRLFGRAQ
jgi:hypothetical protein